jgi:Transposase DDE domain
MPFASPSIDCFAELLARLPPGMDLDALAASTRAIERPRKICDGASLLRMALARGPGGLSLNQTAAWASMGGVAQLSDPAVKYRLDKAVDFLKAIMEQQLAACAGSSGLHWPGRSLRIVDGTNISQRASPGTDWRIHAGFDLGTGGFCHLELTDNRGAESLARGAPVAGEVRIADRNYANAGALHHLCQQAERVDFVVRARWKSFALRKADGTPFDLIDHLNALGTVSKTHEVLVRAAVGRSKYLPLRLIIQRRPDGEIEKSQHRLRRMASRKQKKLDPRTLVAAQFLILATSLPAETYPAAEVLSVYRLRWQIELAFKRLKSLLHIDQLPTRTAAASRSWLYAHLILALLCDDLTQDFLESSPSGSR